MNEPNALIHASSPYLLQHAYNPVHWQEWGTVALEEARRQNKLILVSIGYSACHWCHVMEHESFEDFEVAEVMNRHFVCIKIDREERPDIDQVYMLAVQLMGINGGWPLNCICLPDQRPIYGGTYFRKNDWISILENVADYWANEPGNAIDYATRLAEGIAQAERLVPDLIREYTAEDIHAILEPWKRTFDMVEGGYNRAPKFPLPNNWLFLLRAGFMLGDDAATTATLHTLERIAMGGIYDQVGGGFARYSVDDKWHVPHFEKMLYDNAQMIALYAEAWQFTGFRQFRKTAEECIAWVEREMTSPDGLFYSALDADSEGTEGKFYVWSAAEIDEIFGERSGIIKSYYNITPPGNWEEEHTNILIRKTEDEDFALSFGITPDELTQIINQAKATLLQVRAGRVRPGLDDKCLTAWNAMMIKSLAVSAQIFNNAEYYTRAKTAAGFILSALTSPDGGLYRNYKNGRATIAAFLDDYAFMIDALISLYEYDFDERWLNKAINLCRYVLEQFSDESSPMLFYTSSTGEQLIARKHEIMDNVIPSANSVMAQNLATLGLLFANDAYERRSAEMLAAVAGNIQKYGSAYSNWAIQLLNNVFGINEIAITGKNHMLLKEEFAQYYVPNKIMLGGTKSTLPLLENKPGTETKIYICKNKACNLPVNSVREALQLIN